MSKPKLLLAALALAHLTCASVPLTAPSGSSLLLNANPLFVPANGGQSALIAIVTEPAGTFVPDGTVVFFITDLGRVDAQAKTKDGFARATFVSDSRSGTAHVTAFSGGPSTAPTPTPTTTPTTGASSGPDVVAAATSTRVASADAISATVPIDIGSALPARVDLTADPRRITEPRNSSLTANVFDASGNPVSNVPVIFKITGVSAGLQQESLDSGGQPRFTDTNGQAHDTLRTSQNRADPQKGVTVTATLPLGDESDPVTIFIN